MTYENLGVLGVLVRLFDGIYTVFNRLFVLLFDKNIGQILKDVLTAEVVDSLHIPTEIASIPLGVALFGTGLLVYLVYQFITWILNIWVG